MSKFERHDFLAGNGGSCSDAVHIAAELTGRFLADRTGLPAIALGTNSGGDLYLTISLSQNIFSTFRALSRTGDIFIAISTSGNSRVLKQ